MIIQKAKKRKAPQTENGIVHGAVQLEIKNWCKYLEKNEGNIENRETGEAPILNEEELEIAEGMLKNDKYQVSATFQPRFLNMKD